MPPDEVQLTLRQLGWSAFFEQQLSAEEHEESVPGRVFSVQRRSVTVLFDGGRAEVVLGGRWFRLPPEARAASGDWVLLDASRQTLERLLERKSLITRVPPGRPRDIQLIAANVDTVLLVTSCNEEFNPSRLERYLALALDAGVEPVVVLTKADLAADADAYVERVRALKRDLPVELVDARDPATLAGIRAWCGPGQTVALLGSSGVGKSTLVNSLSGAAVQDTGAIREDDAKGRHTTTGRSLHVLPDGGLLVDNPGMRELSLPELDQAMAVLFEDIDALAEHCRFRDCRHEAEPGCAVRAAVESGSLDPRRLESYRKLLSEEAQRAETVAQSRARFRAQGRLYRQIQDDKRKR